MKINFNIDRGGTFTDIYAVSASDAHHFHILKLLSSDIKHYPDAPREGIRRALSLFFPHETFNKDKACDTSHIGKITMGTTVATNALLERCGERTALIITKGFGDCLFIGNQARPKIFDLNIKMPGVIYERVIEVEERVRVLTKFNHNIDKKQEEIILDNNDIIKGHTKEQVHIDLPLNTTQKIQRDLQQV